MNSESGVDVPRRTIRRVTAEFARLERECATQRILALADLGFDERQISAMTGWDVADVCRTLAGRL